ncbi:hypothetical protein KKC17_02440 [Patescibacteria group bacterium]|nr:hypothetical protein [Patescibacteria group bacterium]
MDKQNPKNVFDDLTNRTISWVGSKSSLVVHTILFAGSFLLVIMGVNLEIILLIITTLVSLEAIYLAIFIQYSVNQQSQTLRDVAEDIEEVTEDVSELSEEVEDISEDVEDISEDVEDISEDVEDISENLEQRYAHKHSPTDEISLGQLEQQLKILLTQVHSLKTKEKSSQPPAITEKNQQN